MIDMIRVRDTDGVFVAVFEGISTGTVGVIIDDGADERFSGLRLKLTRSELENLTRQALRALGGEVEHVKPSGLKEQ